MRGRLSRNLDASVKHPDVFARILSGEEALARALPTNCGSVLSHEGQLMLDAEPVARLLKRSRFLLQRTESEAMRCMAFSTSRSKAMTASSKCSSRVSSRLLWLMPWRL